jgi:hydroxymethylpyrimidine/phosphomethylpyrimidine kinase
LRAVAQAPRRGKDLGQMRTRRHDCALAIGGLDPGGGAGLAADLRGIGAAGAFGCAVIAVVTIQSTSGLRSVVPVSAKDVILQAREVIRHQRVRAIKTGALATEANVRAVGELLARHKGVPAIVDPVMSPSRGRGRLLAERAIATVRASLLPRAALVTANVPEAEALTGRRVTNVSEAHDAALALCRLGARAALVKGGHMTGPQAIDVLVISGEDGEPPEVIELRTKRLPLPPIHGGGCTFAALVAGRIAADGREYVDGRAAVVLDAVKWAKRRHHRLLAQARDVGGEMRVLVP